MLHLVSSQNSVDRVVKHLSNNDAVLFIGDGAFDTCYIDQMSVYVLEDDLLARGIPLPQGVEAVGYSKFVELVVEHENSITW